jgi:glycerate dehydrogenase
MKAVFLDYNTIGPKDLDLGPLFECLPELELFDASSPHEVPKRINEVEYILTNKVVLNASNLEAASNLKLIGLTATGADNFDLIYTKKNNIRVCNIRSYCSQSVVEHIFGVLMNLTHNIGYYRDLATNGAWQKGDDFCLLNHSIRELSSMKMGIIGYGELGKSVAKMAKHFGMRVLINTRSTNHLEDDEESIPLSSLLAEADVISLHCPLTNKTKNLIGKNELDLMKPSSILINTARGALIDSQALCTALAKREIAAAAIDVLPQEPPVDGNALLNYKEKNLIVTPHIAWATVEARQNGINQLAATVRAFQAGKKLNILS